MASQTEHNLTAFVSGHTDISNTEFNLHYVSRLEDVVKNHHKVVMGNAEGVDTLALEHLLKAGHDPSLITVYLFHRTVSIQQLVELYKNKYGVVALGGWPSYNKRDAAMTLCSNYDLCWVRSEEACRALYGDAYRKRVSGTEQNVLRRAKMANKSAPKVTSAHN